MTYEEKKNLVLYYLWENKDQALGCLEIVDALLGKVSESEIVAIINHLVEKKIVDVSFAREVSGATIPILNYQLSFEGLTLLECMLEKESLETLESVVTDIDQCLEPFKIEFVTVQGYSLAKKVLHSYFLGQTPRLPETIPTKPGVKVKLANALCELHFLKTKKPVNFEFLDFMRATFSAFENEIFDQESFFGSNLYKYSKAK